MDENFPIVDPHIHFYTPETHGWLNALPADATGEFWSFNGSVFLPTTYLADTKGVNVVKVVNIQAEYDHDHPVDETRWLQGITDRDKDNFPNGIVGYADFGSNDVDKVLQEHLKFSNMRGIRQNVMVEYDLTERRYTTKDNWMSENWLKGFSLMEKYGLSYDLQLLAEHQAEDAIKLFKRFPKVVFILNHAGLPYGSNPNGNWASKIELMSKFSNVRVKISGLGMIDPSWSVESITPIVLCIIEAFGVDNVMFASNFPVDRPYMTLRSLFSSYYKIVAHFSEEDKKKLFHDNAIRIYRLK